MSDRELPAGEEKQASEQDKPSGKPVDRLETSERDLSSNSGRDLKVQPIQIANSVSTTLPKVFLVNVTLLILYLVCLTVWILVYTDWLPIVGVLFTLTGIFSWLALLFKLVPEDIIKELQRRFVTTWNSKVALVVFLIGGFVLAIWAGSYGAIRLEIQSTTQVHGFDIYPEGSTEPKPHAIRSEGFSNVPVLTSFGSSEWRVKVPGYPYQPVTVRGLRRPVLYVPSSFKRRVLLFVPSKKLLEVRGNYTLRLTIDAGKDHKLVIPRYDWFAFWVGCAADVQIPPEEQNWLAQLRFPELPTRYPILAASLNGPFSDPRWLQKEPNKVRLPEAFDLEFQLPKEIRIIAEDIADKSKNCRESVGCYKHVIDKTITITKSNVSFVQLEYLDNDDWKSK